jgi:DNA-directed RNA polymerase specialized sigma24 family protein
MSELSTQKVELKKDWKLTPRAFEQLLKWLDEGKDSDGQKYVEMRSRLVAYFDRKNCRAPDDLADETLNRVGRRLEEEGVIKSELPAKYCYIVARFVFMESLRATQKDNALRQEIRPQSYDNGFALSEAAEKQERMLTCLDQCTGKLDSGKREIILQYYSGKERLKIERRRALSESLGITVNALSIRACRIRDKLEACVKQCLAAE